MNRFVTAALTVVCICTLLLVGLIWRGGSSLLFLLLCSVLVGGQGVFTLLAGPRGARVIRKYSPERPIAGGEVRVQLEVQWIGGLPPLWVRIHDTRGFQSEHQSSFFYMNALRKSLTIEWTQSRLERGVYRQDLQLVYGDIFGWFTRTLIVREDSPLIVLPARLPGHIGIEDLEGTGTEGESLLSSHSTALYPDMLVRPYTEGDPWNQMYWKGSARRGTLLVRLRNGEERLCCILLDTSEIAYGSYAAAGPSNQDEDGPNERFERAISLTAAQLNRERETGQAVYFRHEGMDEAICWSAEAEEDVLLQLAALRLRSGASAAALLRSVSQSEGLKGAHIILVTGAITSELATEAIAAGWQRGKITLMSISGGKVINEAPPQTLALLREAGVQVCSYHFARIRGASKAGERHDIA